MNNHIEMTEEDKKIVASFVESYANTGKDISEEDKAKALELIAKYNIKINRNPRPIKSRFVKIRQNQIGGDGKIIPYVRSEPKELSKGGKKKLAAKIRKQENIQNR